MKSALGAGFLLALGCAAASAQGTAEPLAIEVVAARHLLARSTAHGFQPRSVTVDPAFPDSISAPGWPRDVRRDSARTAAMAAALDARVAPAREAGRVHLLLSEPAVRGDTAEITVTVAWSVAGRRRGYETLALVLARERGEWRVVRERQLGIS